MLEQRLAICPHCGQVNEKPERVLQDDFDSGFGMPTIEKRHEYRCEKCNGRYEYYWMWHGEKIVVEEVVEINTIFNPNFDPSVSHIRNMPDFIDTREITRHDWRK